MSYSINIKKRAAKALAKLPDRDYQRIRDTIRELGENPRPSGALKLTGREGWRIRIGIYRVIYQIEDDSKIVTILDIGHRRDIYR